MRQFFGCDAHKTYSLFVGMDEGGRTTSPVRVEHERTTYRSFLERLPDASPIAVETVGNWYWMIEEIEEAGHTPFLAHAGKAKLMMGQMNKTDKLDARGLALLLRNGTLPSVWIPPGELRDQRELPRMRMALVRVRTMLKNRIHACLAKFAIRIEGVTDLFGVRGRQLLGERLEELPVYTRRSVEVQLALLDQVEEQIEAAEKQIREVVALTPEMKLLRTVPGVGEILAIVIALEVGEVDRFPACEHLASYGGTVPRVHSSGGRTYHGKVRPDVNRYLKWALVEAANCIVLNQNRMSQHHTVRLYRRVKTHKGHGKAVVAVARHLAEAAYWVLKKGEPYREPRNNTSVLPTRKEARPSHES